MLFDLRYHLTSLVAIFLALAVGILVGSSFIAGSSVKGLEGEFRKLRAENREQVRALEEMDDILKKHTEFEAAVTPLLVEGRLVGRNVAIIQTGDYSEATQRAKSILEQAGANVVSVTTLSNLDKPSAHERIVRSIELVTGETGDPNPLGRLLETVADSIVRSTGSDSLDILESKGLLSTAGEYNHRVLHVVLVGGCKESRSRRAQRIDVPLIEDLKAAGANTIVGVEPYEIGTSYISAYHLKQIPTVDNVDQQLGQVALVYAISGETGNFGMKRSADRIAPEYLVNGKWRYGFRR